MLRPVVTAPPPEVSLPPVPRFDLSVPRPRRRQAGFWLSLAVHALVLAFAIRQGEELWSGVPTPGELLQARGGSDGGGGGGVASYISLPPLPAETPAARMPVAPSRTPPPPVRHEPAPVAPVPPPPAPVVIPKADTATVAARPDSSAPRLPAGAAGVSTTAAPGAGQGAGPGRGGGTGGAGPGTGPGTGPGRGGDGGTITPPTPRTFALTLDGTPKDLRGRQILVTFWVNADGSVARVETDPEIKDADYRRRFLDVAQATQFHPARSPAGLAVAASMTMTYTLPTK